VTRKLVTLAISFFVAFFMWYNPKAVSYVTETKTPEEAASESIQIQSIADEVGTGNYQALSRWLSVNIRAREDRTLADEWKEPHTTLADGTGDCEDYAVLTLEILKRMGVQDVFLLGVSSTTRNAGHVVAFFRENEEQPWQYYDFEKLKGSTKNFKDIVNAVARECRYGSRIQYLLADRDRKNLPPSDEQAHGL